MKKSLLLVFGASLSLAAFAQASAPTAQWGKLLDSNTAGDQASAIAIGTNDNVYWLTTVGSTTTNPDVMFGGEVLFQGELYNSGNSYTNNLCLLATNAQGDALWTIHSEAGDFASGAGSVAVDADGNVIFTAKLRNGDDASKPISIVDAKGSVTEIGSSVERKSYNMLVAKASSDGTLLWNKYITLSTAPGANATTDFISDAIKVQALTVDDEGNIYVGGNFSAEMTIDDVTLTPTNVSSWNGNSQTSSGTMYILKFNADGKYLASEIGSDGVTQSQVTNLEWADGAIYMLGNAQGEAEMEFCGANVTPSAFQSPIVGKLSTDLKAEWLKCLPGEDVGGTCTLQNTGITIVNNTLWIAGMFNGKITDGDSHSVASVAKSPREGVIIKLNANTGDWLAATTSRTGEFTPEIAKTSLQGYYKILQNPKEPQICYAYGYVMNAAVGIVLREYNAETLEPNIDHAWSLATQGGVPSCTAIAYNESSNEVFITGRGNKAFTLLADLAIETPATNNWAVLTAAFKMPDVNPSGIQSIEKDVAAPVEYFNLQGMRVQASSLTTGVYIVRQGANTQKIIVK